MLNESAPLLDDFFLFLRSLKSILTSNFAHKNVFLRRMENIFEQSIQNSIGVNFYSSTVKMAEKVIMTHIQPTQFDNFHNAVTSHKGQRGDLKI